MTAACIKHMLLPPRLLPNDSVSELSVTGLKGRLREKIRLVQI